jgi:para-nitrobenzyl esterase
MDEDDYKVSAAMEDYFANFIKTGNPNGGSLPNWPAAAKNDPQPQVMNINVDSKAEKATNDAAIFFLIKAMEIISS